MTTVDTTKPKTTLGRIVSSILDHLRDARDERFDMQEANLCFRRAKSAIRSMSNGQLYNYDAEEAAELAGEAIGEYEFQSDSFGCIRIIPVKTTILLVLALVIGEVYLALNALDPICRYLQIQSDAMFYVVCIGTVLLICTAVDLVCLWLTYHACNFIVKYRIDKLGRIIEALDNFLTKQ